MSSACFNSVVEKPDYFLSKHSKESGVLSVELKKVKSIDSDLTGNMIIDYDKNGEAVRVNFYDFNFSDFKSNFKAFKDFAQNSRALAKA